MSAAVHRRGVLACLALAPVVALPAAGVIPATATTWDHVKRGLHAAQRAEDAYDLATWRPAYENWSDGGGDFPEAVDAEMERLNDVRCDWEEVVIATPAPDLSQVIWKIEYSRKRWEDSADWPAEWWTAVMADLNRLNGGAV